MVESQKEPALDQHGQAGDKPPIEGASQGQPDLDRLLQEDAEISQVTHRLLRMTPLNLVSGAFGPTDVQYRERAGAHG